MLLITLLAVSSLSVMIAKPATAQTIPAPAVPEFTVRLVNNSYSTQPTTTTTTDPYTGKQTTVTTPSQYVKDEYIEVSIKNPTFTPYNITVQNVDGVQVNLYFNVLSKGHFSDDWSVQAQGGSDNVEMDYGSQYTIVQLYTNNIPSPASIDFKVQAIEGYLYNWAYSSPVQGSPTQWDPRVSLNGTVGNWSIPQTLAIGQTSNQATATSTPAVPELSWLLIVPLLLSVFSVAVIVRHRKNQVKKL